MYFEGKIIKWCSNLLHDHKIQNSASSVFLRTFYYCPVSETIRCTLKI